ncbi:MAG: PIN domain-containing protein [Acidobacteria bacterium]|nr:PIN domain-containing protein [Acidobacteriota bacterium]
MRLFLDANVLFSAAQAIDGRARGLFRLAENGFCELVSSTHAINEARRNILVKHPSAANDLEVLTDHLTRVPEGGPGLVSWATGHGLPENDAPILAAAAAADADLLVTGDRRHFGQLFGKTVGKVRVVPLREALQLVSRS